MDSISPTPPPLSDARASVRSGGAPRSPRRNWGSAILAIVVLAIGLSLTGLALHSVNERTQAMAQAEFNRLTERILVSARRRVDLARYVLNSIRGLFASSHSVERAEFRRFLSRQDLDAGYPGLRCVGFIERVPRDELDAFITTTRGDDAPNFVVNTSGDAPDLLVAKFVEPAQENADILGEDMGVMPDRRAAIERAVRTGGTAMTSDRIRSGDGRPEHRFFYFVPIYKLGSNLTTAAQREAALEGVVFASVVVSELFAGLNQAVDGMLDIDVFAGRELTHRAMILDTESGEEVVDGRGILEIYQQRGFHAIREIATGNGVWTIVTTPTPRFQAILDGTAAYEVVGSGVLSSVLFAVLVWTMGTSRSRALGLAAQMTADLTAAKERTEVANRELREEIAARRGIELHMRHAAMHDPLTGLPNRALLSDRLQQCIIRAARQSSPDYAVLFIDLDNFKNVNDSLGHDAGDELLVEVSHRIASELRAGDTVSRADDLRPDSLAARFGGDEFVVVLERLRRPADAVRIAERIQAALAKPYRLGAQQIPIRCSIGVVCGSADYTQCDALLRDADTAMYRAKSAGKARYALFDESMHVATRERLGLENELRTAVDLGDIHAVYQPIVSLETARVASFEALARWHHPRRGNVPPLEFIRIAEETGMIVPLGWQILEQSCHVLARMRGLPGGEHVGMNVNISRRQLVEPDFVQSVATLLHGLSIPTEALCLEITESVVTAVPGTIESALGQLETLGVKLHLDDFGTGLSSLSLLRTLPLDGIKIDRSFIDAANGDHEAIAILHGITLLGHNLRKSVTAEGISVREQIATILALDCDLAQGYLFGRPAPPAEAEEMLNVDFSALLRRHSDRGNADSPSQDRATPEGAGTPI